MNVAYNQPAYMTAVLKGIVSCLTAVNKYTQGKCVGKACSFELLGKFGEEGGGVCLNFPLLALTSKHVLKEWTDTRLLSLVSEKCESEQTHSYSSQYNYL